MARRPKAMDPDRFQMRDIKRRLVSQEKSLLRVEGAILRVSRRVRLLEEPIKEEE